VIFLTDYTREIDEFLQRLFPICRSITGEGNRKTLQIINEIVPLEIIEYSSGKKVFDWVIPPEWEIRDAYIQNKLGERLVDFHVSNVHVVSYSQPVQERMTFEKLDSHLYYLKDLPEAIPYRTSYYKDDWGFCLNYYQYKALEKDGGPFEVVIDASFKENGSLTVGEIIIKGKCEKEILISTYFCHPSLVNDNLSGFLLTAFLAKELLAQESLNKSYRIIFVPETIGAISYCAMNQETMQSIDTGLVVTCVGGPEKWGTKQSFDPKHYINNLIQQVFIEEGIEYITYPFDMHGSDERQYSSQGFRINVATLCRDKYYEYPFYHTSLDNLEFVKAEQINQSLKLYLKLVEKLDQYQGLYEPPLCSSEESQKSDSSPVYRNLFPNCEVMLSKHGLYPDTGGGILPGKNFEKELDIILFLLFYCDGRRTLSEITEELDLSFDQVTMVAAMLKEKKILSET
jgi:aminopeptidase-like protein